MAQKRDKKDQKGSKTVYQQGTVVDPQETYGLEVIIPAIIDSRLPEGKKLAYLYMIAKGSFSLQCLEDIAQEMEDITKQMQIDSDAQKVGIRDLEAKIDQLDDELSDLALSDALEYRDKLDRFLQYTADHMESGQNRKVAKDIKKIQKGLQKN